MDEMKISTKFMRGILSKIIQREIYKKVGIHPAIEFTDPIVVNIDEGFAHIYVNVHACVTTEDLEKMVKDLV